MAKLTCKHVLSVLMICVLTLSLSIPCFAANTYDKQLADMITQVEALDEGGTPLFLYGKGDIMNIMTDLLPQQSGTTTGYMDGSFTIPASCNNDEVRIIWDCALLDGSTSNAMFSMTITNQSSGTKTTVYLPADRTARAYSFGSQSEGNYSYSLRPYSNVSGTYIYVMKFYTFP